MLQNTEIVDVMTSWRHKWRHQNRSYYQDGFGHRKAYLPLPTGWMIDPIYQTNRSFLMKHICI